MGNNMTGAEIEERIGALSVGLPPDLVLRVRRGSVCYPFTETGYDLTREQRERLGDIKRLQLRYNGRSM